MTVYVMVGAPGAGKGTQAEIIAERLGVPHIASGDLFRSVVNSGTPLGRELKRYMDRGALVPDELTIRMIEARLDEPDAVRGAILDGFPRTRAQAEALDELLAGRGTSVAAAIYVEVGADELLRRLSGRWVCRAAEHVYHEVFRPPKERGVCDFDGSELYQRSDDQPETVRARLDRQLPPMYEVVDHYTDRGVIVGVNGEGPIDQVTEDVMREIAPPAARR